MSSTELDGGGPAGHKKYVRNGKVYWRVSAEAKKRGVKHYKSGGRSKSSGGRSGGRSGKRTSPNRKLSAKSHIATDAELMKIIPKDFKIYTNMNVSEATLAKRLYGNHLKPLTPRIIKGMDLNPGDSFYGIMGTGWMNPQTAEERYEFIQVITYNGYKAGDENGLLPTPTGYRNDYMDGDAIVVNGQVAVQCGGSGRKTYGTNADCEEVYIFIK
jgi:hypothetical protein